MRIPHAAREECLWTKITNAFWGVSMTDGPGESSICRSPTKTEIVTDRTFRTATFLFALLTIFAVLFLIGQVAYVAKPAVEKYGTGFITGEKWDGKEKFGILPEIWGTLYSSILGVFMGSIFGVAIAIFLTQDFIPHRLEVICKNIIELLAAIPSVVYGLWGILW